MHRLLRALLVGCGLAAVASLPASAQTLRTLITSDIRGLMPGVSPDVFTGTVLQHIYEGLVVSRADGTVAPQLAERVDAADEGRTVTFTLREGVTFHNGAPLTSAEVVWTWRQFLDPQRAWPCRLSFDGTRGPVKVDAVEADGPRRVVFRLARATNAFLPMMARPDCEASIAHPASVGADGTWSGAVGTGPFALGEWRRGQFVELVRYAGYRPRSEEPDGYAGRKEARVERLRFNLIPDPSAGNAALVAGEIEVIPQQEPNFLAEMRANPRIRVSVAQMTSVNTLLMQTRDPVLQDVRIRRAINAAIDYASLAESISEGVARPSTSPVPEASAYYTDVERQGHAYDPALARRLLQEAGYRNQPIRITAPPRGAMFDTAITVQAMLRDAGINAEVDAIEFGTMVSRSFSGQFQMMVWLYTPYLDPAFLFERFMGDKGQSPDRIWENREAIAVLGRLFEQTDHAERQRSFDELHRLFIADSPMLIWSTRYLITAMSTRVEGLEAWQGQRLRFWNVSLRPQ